MNAHVYYVVCYMYTNTIAKHNMNLQLQSVVFRACGATFKCECIQIQPQPHTYSQFITTVQLNYATGLPRKPQIFNNFSVFTVQR